MKTILPLLILVIGTVTLHADSLSVSHSIREVTVYPDRALVIRSGKTDIPAGEHQIRFEGLPQGLDESSIRASALSKGFQIRGVELRQDYKTATENVETLKLRDSIRALQDKKMDLADETSTLNEKKSLLEKLSNRVAQPNENAKSSVQIQDIETFIEYYGTQLSDVSLRLREIERENRSIDKDLTSLQSQLALLERPASPNQRSVVVTVSAAAPVKGTLEINYLIHGAGWQPQYDANASNSGEKIQLTSYGIVRQNTGEKWENVQLTLSTARPQQGTSLPDLSPWAISQMQLAPATAPSRSYSADAEMELRSTDDLRANYLGGKAAAEPMQEQSKKKELDSSQLLASNIETRGFTAIYRIPGTVTIPSDSQPHRCTVSIQDMQAKLNYVSTPKLAEGTYIKAEVKNANQAPLLPGQLNIFMENDYIGQNWLGFVGPEGVFELFLGKEDALKVTRKESLRKEEINGVISRSKVAKLGYTLEIENFKQDSRTITLKDQIPVSQNEQIRVKLSGTSIKPGEYNKETGELSWELNLPAKSKKTITVEFEIESPLDVMVGGI